MSSKVVHLIRTLLRTESFKTGILLSSFLGLFAKILNFASGLVIAYFFGTGLEVDVYTVAFSAFILFSSVMNGLNPIVIIPEAMRLREVESEQASMTFLNSVMTFYGLCSLAVMIMIGLFPIQSFSLLSQLSLEQLKQHQGLLLYSLPLFGLFTLSMFLTSILNSYRFFTAPVLSELFTGICNLLFLLLFYKQMGIKSLLLGSNIAYGVQVVFLLGLMKKALKWEFSVGHIKHIMRLKGHISLSFVGNISAAITAYLPFYFLGRFAKGGYISAMSYGLKVANLPTILFVSQFINVASIKFNELASKKKSEEVNQIFLKTGKMMMFLLVPSTCLLFFFSEEVISVLFQRGKFTKESTYSTAIFLQYLGLTLVPLGFNVLINSVMMAYQKVKQGTWYQIASNVLLGFCLFFAARTWGPYAFPKTIAVFQLSKLAFFYFYVRYFFPFIRYQQVLRYGGVLALVHSFLCLVLVGVFSLLEPFSIPVWVQLGGGGLVYGISLLWVNWKANINPDINALLGALAQKLSGVFQQPKQVLHHNNEKKYPT